MAAVKERTAQDPATAIAERLAEHRAAAKRRRDERDDLLAERARLKRERVDLVLDEMAAGTGARGSRRVDERIAEIDRRLAELDPEVAEDGRLDASLAQRERDAVDAARQVEGRRRTEAFWPFRVRELRAVAELEAAMEAVEDYFDHARTDGVPLGADFLPRYAQLRTLLRDLTNSLVGRTDLAGVQLRPRDKLGYTPPAPAGYPTAPGQRLTPDGRDLGYWGDDRHRAEGWGIAPEA